MLRKNPICAVAIAGISASFASSCTNVVHSPPEQATQYVYKCYTDPVPSGYLRVDSVDSSLPGCESTPGQFVVFKYTPYQNLSVGTELRICVDDDLTQAQQQGWVKWTDPYRDAGGCDALASRFTSDPNYKNVLLIKKTQ